MNKKERIVKILESMGYQPKYDDDGDISIKHELKHIYLLTTNEDDDQFISMYLPMFCEIDEGEEYLYMAACSCISRDAKLIKVFVDSSLKHIGTSCDFYFNSDEMLEMNITKSLEFMSIIRTTFRKCVNDLRAGTGAEQE